MPPGSGTGLRDGRAAGRVPAVPGRSGAGGGRQSGIIGQAGVPAGGRTPVNLAVEPAGAVPGRRGTGGCSCPVRRARSCHHAEWYVRSGRTRTLPPICHGWWLKAVHSTGRADLGGMRGGLARASAGLPGVMARSRQARGDGRDVRVLDGTDRGVRAPRTETSTAEMLTPDRPHRRRRPLSGRRQRTSRAGHSTDAGPAVCAGRPQR